MYNLMNDIDESYFMMMINTAKTMNRFKYVWLNNPLIVDCVDELTVNIRQIRAFNVIKFKKPKGITITKDDLRLETEHEVFTIKQALLLYCRSKDRTEEAELLDYSKSTLRAMSDNDFFMAATYVQQMAVVAGALLIPFGITQDQIDELTANLNDFGLLLPKLKLAILKNTKVIKDTTAKIKSSRTMLKSVLDTAVSVYQDTNPDFNTSYKKSRRRVLKSGKHATYMVTINGKVTDSVTKEPIVNAKLVAGKKKKIRTTNSKGDYEEKIYKKDADIIVISGMGIYYDKTIILPTTYINNKLVINIELDRIIPLSPKKAAKVTYRFTKKKK